MLQNLPAPLSCSHPCHPHPAAEYHSYLQTCFSHHFAHAKLHLSKSSTARCLSSLLLWVLLVPSPGGAPLRGPSTVRPASRPRRPPGREAPPYHTGSRALATHPGMHRRTPAALHHSRDSMSCLLQSGDAPGPPLAHADQSAAQETDSFLQSAIASTKQNVHLLSI